MCLMDCFWRLGEKDKKREDVLEWQWKKCLQGKGFKSCFFFYWKSLKYVCRDFVAGAQISVCSTHNFCFVFFKLHLIVLSLKIVCLEVTAIQPAHSSAQLAGSMWGCPDNYPLPLHQNSKYEHNFMLSCWALSGSPSGRKTDTTAAFFILMLLKKKKRSSRSIFFF